MDKVYPPEAYGSNVNDFWNKYRSIHEKIDLPEDRVKEYQRKHLVSAISTTLTRPGTSGGLNTMLSEADTQSLRPKTSNQFRVVE